MPNYLDAGDIQIIRHKPTLIASQPHKLSRLTNAAPLLIWGCTCPLLHVILVRLPIITVDDGVIQISSGTSSVWTEDSVHESLECRGGPKQPKRKVTIWCNPEWKKQLILEILESRGSANIPFSNPVSKVSCT